MLLLIAALQAAGTSYVIDRVCLGAERHYRIDGEVGSTYIWQLTDSIGKPVALANQSGVSFTGTDPVTGLLKVGSEIIIQWKNPGNYELAALQYSSFGCDTLQQGIVQVFSQPIVSAGNPFAICVGSTATLSEAKAADYSQLSWSSAGDGFFNNSTIQNPTYSPGPQDQTSGSVILTVNAQGNGSSNSCTPATSSVKITINAKIVPTFNQIGPLYLNSAAPLLPLSSTNSRVITGSWNPGTINTSTTGTTTYSFTSDTSMCALGATMDIIVANQIIPLFAQIGPFCQNSVPQPLPTISTNTPPVKGTWNPKTISTANVGITSYTFTPDMTQNASILTLNVETTSPITPIFTPIGLLYENSAPPILPLSSNNVPPVTGSWTPAIINTAKVQISTFTFNPDSGQCAIKSALVIQVIEDIVPTFNPMGPFCQNSIAPSLPAVSKDGITGTWNPATINTSTVGVATYVFTPDAGQGATTTTLSITITPELTPTFATIAPMCAGGANPLPATSIEGITGTWSPAFDNTQTTTYTFTPTAGQCAVDGSLTVTIASGTVPTFGIIAPMCAGGANPLPATSIEGITGTWSPAFDNTQTTTYTFTPTAGQCAVDGSLTVTITGGTIPTFGTIAPMCQNSVAPNLPTTSTNGITGIWSPAIISTLSPGIKTYTFTPKTGQCAGSVSISVTITSQAVPGFAPIGPLCLNSTAPVLPGTSTNGITGIWSPAIITTTTTGAKTYTFTATSGQCAAPVTISVTVNNQTVPLFNTIGQLCQNSAAPLLPTTSTNGITGTWSPATISTATAGTKSYSFTPTSGQCAGGVTISVIVDPLTVPSFSNFPSLCQFGVTPNLPTTSTNGITGTWNPTTINSAVPGTVSYTFTPTAGQCAANTTMAITINPQITPLFTPLGTICINSIAPGLPTVSSNGITGTWTPASINTSVAGTKNYKFTPSAGQCTNPITLAITVLPQTTPGFAVIAPICQNTLAPALATTSANGITGTWNPAKINVNIVKTTTYTFTPDANQCANNATTAVTITGKKTPTFLVIGSVCQNSVAPILPLKSLEGITGTWSPSVISTVSVGKSSYTFTPDYGECAWIVGADVTVTPNFIPVFVQIVPICQNSTPPILSQISTNGISGIWSPAVINTAIVGTSNYLFTPLAGECATSVTMAVTINESFTPTFIAIGTLCQNSIAPILPTVSTNGFSGTWSPSTINTSVTGVTTYTFTPADIPCANKITMEIAINPELTPIFTSIEPLCQNSIAPILPGSSTNGIKGTWSPTAINTANVGMTTYKFTPDAGTCATVATLDVTVNPQIIATFTGITPLCQNSPAPLMPLQSVNGVTGTWIPSVIGTSLAGTKIYTFTPTAGQCASNVAEDIVVLPTLTSTTEVDLCSLELPYSWNGQSFKSAGTYSVKLSGSNGCDSVATLSLNVIESVTPAFTPVAPLLQNSVAPLLPDTSLNSIPGKWNPALIDVTTAGTTTYTFTPNSGQCATEVAMDITIQLEAIIIGQSVTGLCQQSSLDASKSIGDIVKYEWTLLDQGGSLDSETGIHTAFKISPAYTGSLPANFRVKLLITSKNGLTQSDTLTIRVDNPPIARISSSGSLQKDGSMIIDGSVSTGTAIKYKWSTAEGKIIGADNDSIAKLFGAGLYTLEISDIHGCLDTKTFKYPMEFHSIVANPDYARISWDQDTTIDVLANDHSSVNLLPGTVTVIVPPDRGSTRVNANGTITYIPKGKNTGSDHYVYQVCDVLEFCVSTTVTIDIINSNIEIPEAFSPNGDGANDQFVILNIENIPYSRLYVYTRSGQLVYQSLNYGLDGKYWDGRQSNNQLVPTGTYYYVLEVKNGPVVKGFVYVGY